MKKLDCSECPWSNPETCRACRAEQASKDEQLVDRLADSDAVKAAMMQDQFLQGFLVLAGDPGHHYIDGRVDRVEWTKPSYGHQN